MLLERDPGDHAAGRIDVDGEEIGLHGERGAGAGRAAAGAAPGTAAPRWRGRHRRGRRRGRHVTRLRCRRAGLGGGLRRRRRRRLRSRSPRLPKEHQRHREDDEEDQALRIHAHGWRSCAVRRGEGIGGGKSGNRVVSARMIRVTAGDALDREPAALDRAVPRDRFHGVIGAARVEAAVRAQQRPDQVLIAAQQATSSDLMMRGGVGGRFPAISAASRRSASTANRRDSCRGQPRLARRIMSKASMPGRARRTASRSRRRTRLRSTARGNALRPTT